MLKLTRGLWAGLFGGNWEGEPMRIPGSCKVEALLRIVVGTAAEQSPGEGTPAAVVR